MAIPIACVISRFYKIPLIVYHAFIRPFFDSALSAADCTLVDLSEKLADLDKIHHQVLQMACCEVAEGCVASSESDLIHPLPGMRRKAHPSLYIPQAMRPHDN
jgi:hypothetical protein